MFNDLDADEDFTIKINIITPSYKLLVDDIII